MSPGFVAAASRSVEAYARGSRLGICQRSVTITLKFAALSAMAASRKCSTDQISVITRTSTIVPMLVRIVRSRFRRTFLKMIRTYLVNVSRSESMWQIAPSSPFQFSFLLDEPPLLQVQNPPRALGRTWIVRDHDD